MAYGIYSDIYSLVESRDKTLVRAFLDNFLPNREEAADEYEVPQYSENPSIVYKNAEELIEYMNNNSNEVHAIYWRSLSDGDPKDAMVFYTSDGCMILGLSIEDEEKEQYYLRKLMSFTNSDISGIAYEQAPPDTKSEFKEFIKNT